MHTIDRRKLMVGGAVGAAAVTAGAVPALAKSAAISELEQTRQVIRILEAMPEHARKALFVVMKWRLEEDKKGANLV
jgi:hypothetical protein